MSEEAVCGHVEMLEMCVKSHKLCARVCYKVVISNVNRPYSEV